MIMTDEKNSKNNAFIGIAYIQISARAQISLKGYGFVA